MKQVSIERFATGGEGVGRLDDGKVVFVSGAVPGDDVVVEITEEKKRHARGRAAEVVTAGADRVGAPCAHVAEGCGGCDWQHVAVVTQLQHKAAIVTDALQRIGRLGGEAVAVADTEVLPATDYRATVRAAVVDGRAGFRQRRSHDPLMIDACLTAHPLVEELLVEGRFGDATEVTLRAGVRTGERLVLTDGKPSRVTVPDGVTVVGADGDGHLTEEVESRRWRISAQSFFQNRPDGADRLVALVRDIVAGADDGALVDLYAGVGLFAGSVAGDRAVTAVEVAASSIKDAQHNLRNLPVAPSIVESRVEQWPATPAAVVVADPARSGLAAAGVKKVGATGATTLALVSCDAGSLGRDAGLLVEDGWRWERSTVVDMFPMTSHVEVVTSFSR